MHWRCRLRQRRETVATLDEKLRVCARTALIFAICSGSNMYDHSAATLYSAAAANASRCCGGRSEMERVERSASCSGKAVLHPGSSKVASDRSSLGGRGSANNHPNFADRSSQITGLSQHIYFPLQPETTMMSTTSLWRSPVQDTISEFQLHPLGAVKESSASDLLSVEGPCQNRLGRPLARHPLCQNVNKRCQWCTCSLIQVMITCFKHMVGRISTKSEGKPEMGEASIVERYNRPLPKIRTSQPEPGQGRHRQLTPRTLNVGHIQEIIQLFRGNSDGHNGPMRLRSPRGLESKPPWFKESCSLSHCRRTKTSKRETLRVIFCAF